IPSTNSPLHQEIGPVMPETFPSLTPVLESFLADNPRTIYFALGTNVVLSPQNVITILNSFLKLIDQNVIDGVIWLLHGGAASSHEAIYTATPMLVLPIAASKIESLLNEEGFKQNAERLQFLAKVNSKRKDWITPDTKMGFIRGKYLDIYGAAFILILALSSGFVYTLFKIFRFSYIKFIRNENINSQKGLKTKKHNQAT
ncbi:12464_t:CDS:2, partial [Gigaspora margarita]